MSNTQNTESVVEQTEKEKKVIPTKLFALPLPADKQMTSDEMLETLANKFKVTKQ